MRIDHFPHNTARYHPQSASLPPEVAAVFREAGRAEVVKERHKRSVFRVYAESASGPPVYFVKYDHPPAWRDKLKGPFRPKVKKEYLVTRHLFERGVPVIEPVCCGWTAFQGIFVSRAVAGAEGFGQLWLRITDDPGLRQPFLKQWRRLLIAAMENNLYHPDFHSGNILAVRKDEDFRLFLVDVVDIQIRRRLSEAHVLQNLRTVWDLRRHLSPTERDFLLGGLPGPLRDIPPRDIWEKVQCHFVQAFYQTGRRHLKKRVFEKNSLVRIVRQGEEICWISRTSELSASRARAIVARYQESRPSGSACRQSAVDLDSRCWLVTEYLPPRGWRPAGVLGRRRVPGLERWFAFWALQEAGLEIPEPLALLQDRNGSGFIIREHPVGEMLAERLARSGDEEDRGSAALFQAMDEFLRELATWKIRPRQLTASDFIVTPGDRLVFLPDGGVAFNQRLTRQDREGNKKRLLRSLPPAAAAGFARWLASVEPGARKEGGFHAD